MDLERISNGEIEITVSPVGAEMHSLADAKTGREYLWQGDSHYWEGHSPILFPATGGLWNGEARLDGHVYNVPKHGFMRERRWQLAGKEADRVTFAYEGRGEDAEAFPWLYRIEVEYKLEGRKVVATFRVLNRSNSEMFFQIGGHPGFILPDFREDEPVSGYLKLEGKPQSVLRATEQGCTEPLRHNFPHTDDGLVPLSVDTFANEALIFDASQVTAATVLRKDRTPIARVESSAPVWLFWSPQGVHSPFVCAEPWYGLCDPIGFDGELSKRPYINSVAPGKEWEGGYSVELLAGK